jgi:hypothetical protein
MALLNFPSNPSVGDTYTIGNRTWIWNGSGWQLQSGVTSYDPFTANRVIVTTSTNSTSTNTGGLLVYGGVGIGLDLTIGGDIHILSTATSTSTTTGALTVAGDVAIAGNLYGSQLYDNGSRVVTQASIGGLGVTALYAGTDTAVSSQTGVVYVWNTSTLQTITQRGNSTDAAINILNSFNTFGTDTGALTVAGGVGINKDLRVNGDAYFYSKSVTVGSTSSVAVLTNTATFTVVGSLDRDYQLMVNNWNLTDSFGVDITQLGLTRIGTFGQNAADLELFAGAEIVPAIRLKGLTGQVQIVQNTSATSTSTGALLVTGGVGVGDAVYIAKTSYVDNSEIVTTGTIYKYAVSNLTAGTDTAVSTSTGAVVVWNTSTLQTVTDRGSSTTNIVKILANATATSTDTGSLQVLGGAGISGDLYAGNMFSNGSSVVTQASLGTYGVANLIAGTDTAISSSTGPVVIWSTATLQSITSRGSETNQALYFGNATSSTDWTTGALRVFGGVGIGDNLNVRGTISATGGFLGLNPSSIYQNTSSVTVYDTGTIRKVVVTVADTTNTVFLDTAVNIYPPLRVFSSYTSTGTDNGALVVGGGVGIGGSVYIGNTSYIKGDEILTTSTVGTYVITTVNAGTDTAATATGRTISIWSTATLQSVTSRGSQTNQVITFSNTSQANSTQTGAIVVTGGAGIGGNVWIGGNLFAYGDATLVGNLTVLGTQTTIYSTATSIQDPTINLGAPSDLGPLATDDGLDKGILVHYNTLTNITGDQKAFFGFRRADEKFVYYVRTLQQGRPGIDNPFTLQTYGGAVFGNVTLQSGIPSSSVSTGDLVTTGGAGIGQNLYVAGLQRINSTTSATSVSSGALVVGGGVGIGGALYIGATSYVGTAEILTTATVGNYLSSAPITQPIIIASTGTGTALTVQGNSLFNGNMIINGGLQINGTVTNIDSQSVNIGDKVIYISTLSQTQLQADGSGLVVGSSASNYASILYDGITDSWVSSANWNPYVNKTFTLGSTSSQWLNVFTENVTSNRILITTATIYDSTITGSLVVSGLTRLTNTTASTGTNSGALVVSGGVGIQGAVNVGGRVSFANTTTLGSTLLLGNGAVDRSLGYSQVIANGYFQNPGDAQAGIYMLRMATTTSSFVELTLDGISVSSVNQIALPNNSTYSFKVYVSARSQNSNDEAGWEFSGVISRYNGPGTISMKVVNKTKLWSSVAAYDCEVQVDTVNGALQVVGKSDGTRVTRFVAKVETVEVTN